MHKEFSDLFESYEYAHAIYKISGYDDSGKKIGKGLVTREASNPVHWQKHLDGDESLGGFALLNDNTCKWAAIDVDDMQGQTHKQIIDKIKKMELPLICFRSASGNAHLFVFCSEKVDAQLIRARLSDWSSKLGLADSEIFPKQTYRKHKEDYGNYLNMPYFQGEETERYAFDGDGKKLSPKEFLDFVKDKKIIEKDIRFSKKSESESEYFQDGAPCMQHLENAEGGFGEGGRNNGMINVAVYLKKRYPEDWRDYITDYNSALCQPPLPYTELSAIIKSAERKDYEYMCKEPPINIYCNKKLCRKRKYGIGCANNDLGFDIDNLTKLEGDPVRWIAEIEGQRIELSTKELINQNYFREACVDALNKYPKHMNKVNWDDFIQEKLEKLSSSDIIFAPDDSSRKGQFYILFEDYLTSQQALNKDQIHEGKPYWDNKAGDVTFTSTGLRKYLDGERFKYDDLHQIWEMIREKGCKNKVMRVKGKNIRVWTSPQPEKIVDIVEPVLEFSENDNPNKKNEAF